MQPDMRGETSWDFRGSQELLLSDTYAKEGYVIEDADFEHLEYMKNAIETAFREFYVLEQRITQLTNAHQPYRMKRAMT